MDSIIFYRLYVVKNFNLIGLAVLENQKTTETEDYPNFNGRILPLRNQLMKSVTDSKLVLALIDSPSPYAASLQRIVDLIRSKC